MEVDDWEVIVGDGLSKGHSKPLLQFPWAQHFHVDEVDGGPEDVELDGDDEHPRQDTLEQGHQRGCPLFEHVFGKNCRSAKVFSSSDI